jgi:class 3 adenylate cyclase
VTFCHGSPASTKSWLAQVVLSPHQTQTLSIALGEGRYRVQTPGAPSPVFLDVHATNAPTAARIAVGRADEKPRFDVEHASVSAGIAEVVLANDDDVPHRVQLAHRAFASQAATAADVTATGLFRELFGQEALAPDQHVEVGEASILFTDLVGSTAMYEARGDATAFSLVRAHFRLLFDAIEGHRGRVVKTVGDCVMAAFDVPLDACEAGLRCIEVLRTLRDDAGDPPGLRLKVGVHTGACLAVQQNGVVDYFGRAVNIAARVESLAHPDELVLSWATRDALDVRERFLDVVRARGLPVVADHKPVKGIEGEVEIVRITP